MKHGAEGANLVAAVEEPLPPDQANRIAAETATALRPYRAPVPNALNLLVWLAVVVVACTAVYLEFIPHRWLAGLGANQTELAFTYPLDPHFSDSRIDVTLAEHTAMMLGGAALFGGWLGLRRINRSLARKIQAVVFLFWISSTALPNSLSLNEKLSFTPSGVAFRWGFVPFSRVVSYRWVQPYAPQDRRDIPTAYGLLTLTMGNAFPLPHTFTWAIGHYDEGDVDKVLRRYLPRRGNRPPGPLVVAR